MSEDTIIRFVDDSPLVYEDKNDTEEGVVLTNGETLVIDTGLTHRPLFGRRSRSKETALADCFVIFLRFCSA